MNFDIDFFPYLIQMEKRRTNGRHNTTIFSKWYTECTKKEGKYQKNRRLKDRNMHIRMIDIYFYWYI